MAQTEQALVLALQAKVEQLQKENEYFMPRWSLSRTSDEHVQVLLRQTSYQKLAGFPLYTYGARSLLTCIRHWGGFDNVCLQWRKNDTRLRELDVIANIEVQHKKIIIQRNDMYYCSMTYKFPHQEMVRRLVSEFCDILHQHLKDPHETEEIDKFQSSVEKLLAQQPQ